MYLTRFALSRLRRRDYRPRNACALSGGRARVYRQGVIALVASAAYSRTGRFR